MATNSYSRGLSPQQASRPIGFIGAGSWGTTLAHIAARKGRDALLWVRREDLADEITNRHTNERYLEGKAVHPNVRATTSLKEVCDDCELLFVVVPTKHFRSQMKVLGDFLRGDHCVISCSKGIEIDTHQLMSQIVRHETCVKKIGVLSGPNLAAEIMDGLPTGTVIASRYEEVIDRGAEAISDEGFRVYSNHDVVGVELGGSLKNIYAIASGLLMELEGGVNARSMLMTRALAEMARVGKVFGAEPITFSGLAGIGDLIATCSSQLSRNFQVGRRLGKGESLEQIRESMFMVAEGVFTLQATMRLRKEFGIDLPIIETLHDIVFNHAKPEGLFEGLMRLNAKYEVDGLRQ